MESVRYQYQDGHYYIQLLGDLGFQTSSCLARLIDWITQDELVQGLTVDLQQAESIDSTNLGLLSALGQMMWERRQRRQGLLPGESPRVTITLESLGIHKFFDWTLPVDHMQSMEQFVQLPPPQAELPTSVCERAISAHQSLMSINDANRREFAPILAALRLEIALMQPVVRHESAQAATSECFH